MLQINIFLAFLLLPENWS